METQLHLVLEGKEHLYAPCEVSLHTHSHYCGHGSGDIKDFERSARTKGLKVIGFSEHCPLPNDRWNNTRMEWQQLGQYMTDVEDEQRHSSLVVLKGMECDYLPEYHSFYQQEMLGTWGCQYLIGSIHYINSETRKDFSIHKGPMTSHDLIRYTEHYIDMLESGLFLFGAHPDVFGYSYFEWDDTALSCSKAIIEAASSLKVPLEINANGFRRGAILSPKGYVRPYPLRQFWEIASDYDIVGVVSSDAHHPNDVIDSCDTCIAFAKEFSIPLASLHISTDKNSMIKPQYVVA